MSPTANRVALGALVLLNVALGAFAIQLAAGAVPVPESWAWAVPILLAVVTAATTLLPRAGSETLASQVDTLQAQGVRKRDMRVVPWDDAPEAEREARLAARFPDGPLPPKGGA